MQIVSNQDIKCPEEICNWILKNRCIHGDVIKIR